MYFWYIIVVHNDDTFLREAGGIHSFSMPLIIGSNAPSQYSIISIEDIRTGYSANVGYLKQINNLFELCI